MPAGSDQDAIDRRFMAAAIRLARKHWGYPARTRRLGRLLFATMGQGLSSSDAA